VAELNIVYVECVIDSLLWVDTASDWQWYYTRLCDNLLWLAQLSVYWT